MMYICITIRNKLLKLNIMKIETKLKRVKNNLIKNNSFTEMEADKSIKETLSVLNIEKYTVSYFTRFLISTYNVDGVER